MDAYSALVTEENGISGIIAYGRYKKHKREWKNEFYAKHNRKPTEQEVEEQFFSAVLQKSQMERYLNEAIDMVDDFADFVAEETMEMLDEEYEQRLCEKLKEYKPKFWIGMFQSLLSTLAGFILIGILIFAVWSMKFDFMTAVKEVSSVVSPPKAPPPNTP